MKILISAILPKRSSNAPATQLLETYLERSTRYVDTTYRAFPNEPKLLAFLDESSARTRPTLLLTDSRGAQLSSTELATAIGSHIDSGTQLLVLAIGPADGWSPAALARADLTLAFGRITLPHELAAVIAAEQLYRSLTIRAGHPYHSGH
jgi:23S rRNA (pseudouridine1915-N3)-methyltransferase